MENFGSSFFDSANIFMLAAPHISPIVIIDLTN